MSKNDSKIDIDKKINQYINFVARFDNDIADRIKMEIRLANNNYEKIIKIIDRYIDELIQLVIVDINEHKSY